MLALLFYTFPFPLAQVSILVLLVRAPEFSFAVRLLRFPFHLVTIGFCFYELLRMGLTAYPAQTNVEPTGVLRIFRLCPIHIFDQKKIFFDPKIQVIIVNFSSWVKFNKIGFAWKWWWCQILRLEWSYIKVEKGDISYM